MDERDLCLACVGEGLGLLSLYTVCVGERLGLIPLYTLRLQQLRLEGDDVAEGLRLSMLD